VLSPPWGGVDYKKVGPFDLESTTPPCSRIMLKAQLAATTLAMIVPRNTDPDDLRALPSPSPLRRIEYYQTGDVVCTTSDQIALMELFQ
jgi:hypothetical protein